MFKQVLISVSEHGLRVAMLEDGQLVELFMGNEDEETLVGSIFKARIEGVVPTLQAAFVNIGQERNAFMHFSDVLPESLDIDLNAPDGGLSSLTAMEDYGGKRRRKSISARRSESRSVEKLLKPGREILVQVTKDPINTKGPRVTSTLSLPGRYLVSLPYPGQSGGVSKKVTDLAERKRLKRILADIEESEGGSAHIVRTVGIGRTAEEIKQDVGFLDRQWKSLLKRQAKLPAPALIHDDHDLIYRLTRDVFHNDIAEIWVDDAEARKNLLRNLKEMIPDLVDRVELYRNKHETLFDYFDVERQVRRALRRKVWLKSGGHLIFDEMEALTAVDVNSGKFTGRGDQQKMILKINTEAAHMVARQLRLRDIGGLIVIDFIDMEKEENRRSVLGELKALLRSDRARVSLTSISEFGLVEMTRQRVRKSLRKQIFRECPHCQGEGMILSDFEIWRWIKREILSHLAEAPRPHLDVRCHPRIAAFINQETREVLDKLARLYRIEIDIRADDSLRQEEFEVTDKPKEGARKPKARKELDDLQQAQGRDRWKMRRDLWITKTGGEPESDEAEEDEAPDADAAARDEEADSAEDDDRDMEVADDDDDAISNGADDLAGDAGVSVVAAPAGGRSQSRGRRESRPRGDKKQVDRSSHSAKPDRRRGEPRPAPELQDLTESSAPETAGDSKVTTEAVKPDSDAKPKRRRRGGRRRRGDKSVESTDATRATSPTGGEPTPGVQPELKAEAVAPVADHRSEAAPGAAPEQPAGDGAAPPETKPKRRRRGGRRHRRGKGETPSSGDTPVAHPEQALAPITEKKEVEVKNVNRRENAGAGSATPSAGEQAGAGAVAEGEGGVAGKRRRRRPRRRKSAPAATDTGAQTTAALPPVEPVAPPAEVSRPAESSSADAVPIAAEGAAPAKRARRRPYRRRATGAKGDGGPGPDKGTQGGGASE